MLLLDTYLSLLLRAATNFDTTDVVQYAVIISAAGSIINLIFNRNNAWLFSVDIAYNYTEAN